MKARLARLCVAALTLALAAPVFAEPVAPRPDLQGRVLESDGQPLPGAFVFVYTAGPKEGSSTLCPSCFADCSKKAETDAAGRFTIPSLDPKLLFRLLVVSGGHAPQFVRKTDPGKGPVDISMKRLTAEDDVSRLKINGLVIDDRGQPVPHAIIGPQGMKIDRGEQWGGTDDFIDPLAVADDHGRFTLTCLKNVSLIHAVASGRGVSQQWVDFKPDGDYLINLHDGVTVTGQIMRQGRPVPDATVIAGTVDRICGIYFDCDTVSTDQEGRFRLLNVPANCQYNLAAAMASLRGQGALPARTFRAQESGTTLDLGKLELVPGHMIRGRVVLSDGKDIPAGVRLLLTRQDLKDAVEAIIAPDGSFAFTDVPAESVGLGLRLNGYRFSKRNPSLDWCNGGVCGRVTGDIANLTLLLEPGQWQINPRPEDLPKDPEPRDQPLRGLPPGEFARQ